MHLRVALLLVLLMFATESVFSADHDEKWESLFDGKSLTGWRGFKKQQPPAKGWVAQDGVLRHVAKGGGGDIITDKSFEDFDLRWEWRAAEGANSGVKYFISEERSSAIGHEYQLIDDARHPDAKLGEGKRVTGAFYDVLKPGERDVRPAGQWNSSRIVVQGKKVEHFLNGKSILRYELESDELRAAIAKSKFKTTPNFGKKIRGHILLQDHGDEIEFRDIKIQSF